MLVSSAAIPTWDALLVADFSVAARSGSGQSALRIGILNDEEQVYREFFSEDISELAALLARLASLGFQVVPGRQGVQMQWQRSTPFSREWPRSG